MNAPPACRTFLVTGVRAPAALELIRRLGRAGHDVLAADCVRAPMGRFSRYVRRYLRLPGPRTDPAGFVAALRRILLDEGVDVLLPTCEEIYHISRHRETLEEICQVFCPGFEVLTRLHHKSRFAELTYQLGGSVMAPESKLIEDRASLEAFAPESDAWVFKPVYSRFAARTLVRPPSSRLAVLTLDPSNPWMAQRFVAGRELCSYGIAVDGRLTAHTLYHSRHRSGHAGIYFEPEENAAISGFVERLVAHLKFTGQIAFDFIVCGTTGRAFVLECNPRSTSGVHLLPQELDLAGALRGEADPRAGIPNDQTPKMLGMAMLTSGLRAAVGDGRIAPWWRDLVRGEDVVSARDDRLPTLGQFAFLAEIGGLGLRHGMGLTAAMTADIEWNG